MASTAKFLGRRGDGFALWLGGGPRQGGEGLLCQVSYHDYGDDGDDEDKDDEDETNTSYHDHDCLPL